MTSGVLPCQVRTIAWCEDLSWLMVLGGSVHYGRQGTVGRCGEVLDEGSLHASDQEAGSRTRVSGLVITSRGL